MQTLREYLKDVSGLHMVIANEAFTGRRCFIKPRSHISDKNKYNDYIVWADYTVYNRHTRFYENHVNLIRETELPNSQKGGDYE